MDDGGGGQIVKLLVSNMGFKIVCPPPPVNGKRNTAIIYFNWKRVKCCNKCRKKTPLYHEKLYKDSNKRVDKTVRTRNKLFFRVTNEGLCFSSEKQLLLCPSKYLRVRLNLLLLLEMRRTSRDVQELIVNLENTMMNPSNDEERVNTSEFNTWKPTPHKLQVFTRV